MAQRFSDCCRPASELAAVRPAFYPDRRSEKTPVLVYAAGGRPWAMFPEYLYVYLKDGRVTEAKIVAD